MADTSIPQKQCRLCKQFKPPTLEYFHKSSKVKCGLKARCKVCENELIRNNPHNAEYQKEWAEKNKEKTRKYARDHQRRKRSDPEKHALMIEYERERRKLYPELYRDYSRQFRKNNPEKVNAYNRRYYAKHAEWGRVSSLIRHHRRRGIKKHYHTAEDIVSLYEQQKGKCWWCEQELNNKFEIDHRIPVSKGGSNALNNIVLSCQFCNRSKHNHMPWEWNGRLL